MGELMLWVRRGILVLALAGCRAHEGGSCGDPEELRCRDNGRALVCGSGHWAAMDCKSPCDMKNDPPCAQPDVGRIGKGCYLTPTRAEPEEVIATTDDGRTCLRCNTGKQSAGGGVWEAERTCGPGMQCESMGGCVKARTLDERYPSR